MSSPEFQGVEREMAPRLAAFRDEIIQNEKLFRRIEAVYQSPDKAQLTPEQQRLVWLHYTNFVRAGAKLDAAGKARVAAINQRLAALYTTFSQNLLADEEQGTTVLEDEADLAGLPDSFVQAAAAEAERKGLSGQWVIANTRSSAEPFLTYSDRRDLREQVWRSFVSRGDHAGERDNKPLITEILRLRAERARLLGYPTHAHWRLENSMAETPSAPWSCSRRSGSRPSPACGRRWPTCSRSPTPRAPGSGSSRGTTATTPRRSARRSTTWTRTR